MPAKTRRAPMDGERVMVQGYEFTARSVRIIPDGDRMLVRFRGECTADRRNDPIRNTPYNGGVYGWTL